MARSNGASKSVIFLLPFFLSILQPLDAVLKCYKCTMTAPPSFTNETVRLCANFDYSDRYIVECPYSTVCMKKDFTVNLTVPINGTVRDCANQRYDYQDYKNGKWQLEVQIEEPYTEGCSDIDDKGFRSSRTQFCYCRGDLCNGSVRTSSSWRVLMAAIFTFKYAFRILPSF